MHPIKRPFMTLNVFAHGAQIAANAAIDGTRSNQNPGQLQQGFHAD